MHSGRHGREKYFQRGKELPLDYCWPPLHGLPGWLIVHKVPYLTNDALADGQIVHELCRQFGVRAALSTPILSGQGEVLGFFEIHNKPGGFTASDQQKLLSVSYTAAVAIQNALAYTRVREAEESLREADRRKDEFLAILGHELRNPLAPLRAAVDLLGQSGEGTATIGQLHDMMDRQLQHLTRLVDDLLDVSRITSGRVELRRGRFDLQDVIGKAIELTRPLVELRRHELIVERTEVRLPIDGDFDRLVQIVGNLLTNAAKYTPPGGTITLRTGIEGNQAVVRVRDTGMGIPAERLEALFEMFSQVPEHRMNIGGGGLGIGLALAQRLVALHGGSIEAHSEGPGSGSELIVRLPLAALFDTSASATRAASHATPRPTSAHADPRRVLIVDDNVDAAESLRLLLELDGHVVEARHDGPSALTAITSFAADVVLLDIGLPRMDGYEVARRLRALPRGRDARLYAVTGWGQAEDKRRALEAGFDGHLTKPINRATLQRAIADDST